MPEITPEYLDELERLTNAATEGPWEAEESGWGRTLIRWSVNSPLYTAPLIYVYANCEPDALFIATSRTALPALIAEVRKLQKERDELRAIVAKFPTTADGVPVVPGMTVYDIEGNDAHVRGFIYGEWFDASVRWGETGENDEIRCEYYYSTPEAAEAAREGK